MVAIRSKRLTLSTLLLVARGLYRRERVLHPETRLYHLMETLQAIVKSMFDGFMTYRLFRRACDQDQLLLHTLTLKLHVQ